MKIVTADEMRRIDRLTSERFGVPSLTLMENAGTAVADFILQQYPAAKMIGVLCGKGNNGGDGFVCARRLRAAGKKVAVLLLAAPAELRGDAAAMFRKMGIKPVLARNEKQLAAPAAQRVFHCDLLVDALLGTGFKPPVEGLYLAAIQHIWKAHVPVVSVDVPSGRDADEPLGIPDKHVIASAVVSFTAPKLVHIYGEGFGQVAIADIGSPPEAIVSSLNREVITADDILHAIAPRDTAAHKGEFGHVLTLGGSLGKTGAAAMAGISALRAGAGLSTVGTAEGVLPLVAGYYPEVMTEPLAQTDIGSISLRALDYGRLDTIATGKDVLAIGPGMSRHPDTVAFVRAVVRKYRIPMVIDADGLNAFEGATELLDGTLRPLVLTPHPGEMSRLTGIPARQIQNNREAIASEFAQKHSVVLVLKGSRTVVAEPGGRVWVNTTGNAGMATGGTGDILTGMVAGMIAREVAAPWTYPDRPYENVNRAVCAAVHLHGMAGDFAAEKVGQHSLIATDLLLALPQAFARALQLIRPRFVWVRRGHEARLGCR